MIEDEQLIAEPTQEILKGHNYVVDLAFDGEEGLYAALTDIYDLILLDIMLPKMDGFEVLKRLRQEKIQTPVLMLTARDQMEDKIHGFEYGADDYLPKPFEYPELLARMRALLRRSGSLNENNTLRFGNLELDPYASTLISEAGSLNLTLKEAQLMEIFMKRSRFLTSKELILNRLWDLESDASDANVEYHVSKLRSKIKKVQGKVQIKSSRGQGYQLIEG